MPSFVHSVRPGHKYGKVTAGGNAKILMGNVSDSMRPNGYERQHEYGEVKVDGNVDLLQTDINGEQMGAFFRRPA